MFKDSFEKTAVLRTSPARLAPPQEERRREYPYTRFGGHTPTSMNELEFDALRAYSGVKHSPLTRAAYTGGKWGLGVGLPVAAIAALAAPAGQRLKKAMLFGASFGGPAAIIAAAIRAREQVFRNKIEDAHLNYHLDRMGYVPREQDS